MTCCFFSSLKTLLTMREDSALPPNQCPGCWFDGLRLAGFQVSITGWFWVSTEVCTSHKPVHTAHLLLCLVSFWLVHRVQSPSCRRLGRHPARSLEPLRTSRKPARTACQPRGQFPSPPAQVTHYRHFPT